MGRLRLVVMVSLALLDAAIILLLVLATVRRSDVPPAIVLNALAMNVAGIFLLNAMKDRDA